MSWVSVAIPAGLLGAARFTNNRTNETTAAHIGHKHQSSALRSDMLPELPPLPVIIAPPVDFWAANETEAYRIHE